MVLQYSYSIKEKENKNYNILENNKQLNIIIEINNIIIDSIILEY